MYLHHCSTCQDSVAVGERPYAARLVVHLPRVLLGTWPYSSRTKDLVVDAVAAHTAGLGLPEIYGFAADHDYDEVLAFPASLLDPAVLEATASAKAAVVFDEFTSVVAGTVPAMLLGHYVDLCEKLRPRLAKRRRPEAAARFFAEQGRIRALVEASCRHDWVDCNPLEAGVCLEALQAGLAPFRAWLAGRACYGDMLVTGTGTLVARGRFDELAEHQRHAAHAAWILGKDDTDTVMFAFDADITGLSPHGERTVVKVQQSQADTDLPHSPSASGRTGDDHAEDVR